MPSTTEDYVKATKCRRGRRPNRGTRCPSSLRPSRTSNLKCTPRKRDATIQRESTSVNNSRIRAGPIRNLLPAFTGV